MEDCVTEQEQKELVISSNELMFLLSRFIRMYQRSLYRTKPPYMPYRGQIRVLHIIADNDGLSQKELAELLDIRSASMSELLNKLERSDLIRREKDESDKRIMHVFLSSDGQELVKNSKNQDDFAEMLFDSLSADERYSFHKILKELCACFEAQSILEGDDRDEPLPPHLKDGRLPPLPPEPLPPHLKDGRLPPLPPEGKPLPPHLRKKTHPPSAE